MSAEAVHYNMHDAKTHLTRIIERVERGEEIIIDRAGTPRREGRSAGAPGQSDRHRRPGRSGRFVRH